MKTKHLAAGALLALAMFGCSKSSDTPASSGTTAAPAITKAEYIAKGDAICQKTKDEIEKQLPGNNASKEEIAKYFVAGLKLQREQVQQLKALPQPTEGADQLKAMFAKTDELLNSIEAKLPAAEKDPSVITEDTTISQQNKELNKLVQDFGFKVCGNEDSGSSSGSTSGTTKPTNKTNGTSPNPDIKPDEGTSPNPDINPDEGISDSPNFDAELDRLSACADLALANLDLIAATDTASAKAAAEKIEKFDPPADIERAIQVLVDGPGLQLGDDNTVRASDALTQWINKTCPTG